MPTKSALFTLAFFAFLTCQTNSWADEVSCLNKASSTLAILECNQQEILKLSTELDTIYSNMEVQISDSGIANRSPDLLLKKLKASQSSWKLAMENSCEFSGLQRGGGPMWKNVFASECQIIEIKQRLKFFEVILNSPH